MHERGAALERRMRAGDHEGRALHRAAHAQRGAEAAHEGRLAGAEGAGEHDGVAGLEHAAEDAAEGAHLVGRGDRGGADQHAAHCPNPEVLRPM